jgi:broad specificity phosphatase PhoE
LRVLILPKRSEEKEAYVGQGRRAVFQVPRRRELQTRPLLRRVALEEAFGVYRSALREVRGGAWEGGAEGEVGEEPFKRVRYMLDLGRLAQLAEKEEARPSKKP